MANSKNKSGAKAPGSAKKKQTTAKQKDVKQNKDEWLEEELKDVKVEETDSDALMKQAAEQLESLQAEVKEWKDNYLRLHAEWDTYRRRSAEQREAEKATASEALVTDILPVLDDFERSISMVNMMKVKQSPEGV